MSLASDYMGFGMPDKLAISIAVGGNGPLTIAAAGTTFATATRIQCRQFLVSCTNTTGTNGLALPVVGGENGALLADDFIINNAGTTSLQVFASSGVIISTGGTNTSQTTLQQHTTMTLYPITNAQWIAVKGS